MLLFLHSEACTLRAAARLLHPGNQQKLRHQSYNVSLAAHCTVCYGNYLFFYIQSYDFCIFLQFSDQGWTIHLCWSHNGMDSREDHVPVVRYTVVCSFVFFGNVLFNKFNRSIKNSFFLGKRLEWWNDGWLKWGWHFVRENNSHINVYH